jgi:hypothetical protein
MYEQGPRAAAVWLFGKVSGGEEKFCRRYLPPSLKASGAVVAREKVGAPI